MDDNSYKKPAHVKEAVWRQHLSWVDVIEKQLEENRERRRKSSRMGSALPPVDDTSNTRQD